MIYNNSDAFIDWATGQCYFDSDEFIRLLEISKIHNQGVGEITLPVKLISEGRQLLYYYSLSDVSSIQRSSALFGGEVNFIGFPTSHGIGNAFMLENSVSIFAQSENIEACWQFIRDLMTYETQIEEGLLFPANYEALQERLNNPAKYEESGASVGDRDSEGNLWSVTFTDATPEESEQVRQLIESCDRVYREDRAVMEIIFDEVPAYFAGDKTAEEVCAIIQNRAQTYIWEQG